MRLGSLTIAAAVLVAALVPLASGQAQADTDTETLRLHCNVDRPGINSFESWYAHQQRDEKTGCWAHFGHHHYFAGRDHVYALHGGTAKVASTESELSPFTEPGDPGYPPHWQLPIEVSMDGTEWRKVAYLNHDVFEPDWQTEFTFEADGEEFRYLRIRQPHSAAQGLSGYLDKSSFRLNVSVVGAAPQPTLSQQTVDLSCASDILEVVYPTHPCWFGGIHRYDAPSFFHTYPLGAISELDRVEGSVVTNNFRIGPLDAELIPDTDSDVFVQTSINGSQWQTVHTFPVVHGEPTSFSADLAGEQARFVRFATSRHPLWADDPAAKHPEGLFLRSDLTVTGMLPS